MEDSGEQYVVQTAGTTLRPVRPDDLDPLHRLWTHPDVRRHLWDDEVIPRGRAEAAITDALEDFEKHDLGLWVAENDEGVLVGFCGLRHLEEEPEVEVFYGVAPTETGRGLATQMASAMLHHGFERIGLPRILGITDKANTASRRVLEKAGMTFERYALNEGRKEARYSIQPEAPHRSGRQKS